MFDIVLFEPEIPQNTGAIARTCAATGARLHLIKPLGFDISDAAVKRAGLDYWHLVDVSVYESIDEYLAKNGDASLWLLTTKARAAMPRRSTARTPRCCSARRRRGCRRRCAAAIMTAVCVFPCGHRREA